VRTKGAQPTSYRLSDEAKRLLAAIASQQGIGITTTLEWIIREKARELGLTGPEQKNGDQAEA